jgi:8-oxo-dGTP diphosphatase
LGLDELGEAAGFAVHLTLLDGRLVLVRNRERSCWELPGGRRDPGESIQETARRELAEECGPAPAIILPWCGYEVQLADRITQGLLCLTRLERLPGPPPESEIAEARAVDVLPGLFCYPHIQGRILQQALPLLALALDGFRPPALPASLLSCLADSPAAQGQIPPLP